MKILALLFILAAPPIAAQTTGLPEQVGDHAVYEDLEFLYRMFRSVQVIRGPAGRDGTNGTNGAPGAPGEPGTTPEVPSVTPTAVDYLIITSTGLNRYYVLTATTSGYINLASTTTATSTLQFLYNGEYTSWITADSSDGVLRLSPTTLTTVPPNIVLFDAIHQAWTLSMDTDGVLRMDYSGGL